MNVTFINPFLVAVQNIFDTMIDLSFSLGQPALKKEPIPSYEVSGIIGLSGSVSGCVVINLSKELALKLASALLDEAFTELNDDCTDAIGEIANMIAGNAKTDFPVENTSISVPSVVVGKHKMTYPSGVPIVSIPCETSGGQLVIDIALKENA
jgi:chemotaxis protein CheX